MGAVVEGSDPASRGLTLVRSIPSRDRGAPTARTALYRTARAAGFQAYIWPENGHSPVYSTCSTLAYAAGTELGGWSAGMVKY